MRYALLCYDTTNLGDEIQSLAARQFLPRTDILVDRDWPGRVPEGGPYQIVFNGWHNHRPENWPPSPSLDPLLVSVHVTREVNSANKLKLVPSEVLLEGANLEYWKAHGPVGTRDLATKALFEEHGVEAYFSGCMTLTLGDGRARERGDYVCAVDLAKPLLKHLCGRVPGRVVTTAHEDYAQASFEERCAKAETLLSLYARAKCVVTSRLHCALPCLALGTPVLFVISAPDRYRFSGLSELVRNCTNEAFLGDRSGFDPNDPAPNSEDYRVYRDALIRRVNGFIDPARTNLDAAPHPFVPRDDVEPIIADERARMHTRPLLSRLFGGWR